MLITRLHSGVLEAGLDEAGRGPLAGPVFAAAVILPDDFAHDMLDDSKKLTAKRRYALREVIIKRGDGMGGSLGIAVGDRPHKHTQRLLQGYVHGCKVAIREAGAVVGGRQTVSEAISTFRSNV